MKRTTVFLDDQLLYDVQRLARKKGVSFAMVVREALSVYMAEPTAGNAVPSVAGRFASGTADTSATVDEHLWRDPHG